MSTVLLVDVDNTLLDNDRVRDDLRAYLGATFGEAEGERYWELEGRRFAELGYRDYLGAAQGWWEAGGREPAGFDLARFLLDYPFADRLFPRALEVLARFRTLGATVVLTDGDAVFQPYKIRRSGIWDAVGGAVLVYVHKEVEFDDVERRYPAERYVLVDDKPAILAAAKAHWGSRVTTVLPLQGQFAAVGGAADVTVDRLADLLHHAFD